MLEVQEADGSLAAYLWGFVGGTPIVNRFRELSEIPAETEESRAMSKDLKRRGFRFVGPTICYAFMQSTGMVNDHVVSCFRYAELTKALAPVGRSPRADGPPPRFRAERERVGGEARREAQLERPVAAPAEVGERVELVRGHAYGLRAAPSTSTSTVPRPLSTRWTTRACARIRSRAPGPATLRSPSIRQRPAYAKPSTSSEGGNAYVAIRSSSIGDPAYAGESRSQPRYVSGVC